MNKIILSALALGLTIASCKKENKVDEDPVVTPGVSLPTTYNFDNVSYSGQTDRLDMLAELTLELKKANSGNLVDSATLFNMFNNTNAPFTASNLNSSTKQLKNKCYNSVGAENVTYFEYLMRRQADISANAGNTWAPNNQGVATSGTKQYFFDEYGVEYTQIIEKGLMGAVFYYQIAETYTRAGKIGDAVDNTNVTPGEGTDMEHHWDEAFGYWGAPIDFSSTNTTGSRFHAKYALKGDAAGLNTVSKVMNQFIKGRYGISNENYTMRDEAAVQIRKEYEMILATTAIHYMNSAKTNFSDDALRNHALSEAYAFLFSLAYNSDKLISGTDLATAKAYFEAMAGPTTVPNFLNVTVTDINSAIDIISTTYGLDAVKATL